MALNEERQQIDAQRAKRSSVLRIAWLSLSFFLLFLSYEGTQSLQSSVVPENYGYMSLAAVYLFWALSSLLFSAKVVSKLTPATALKISALGYTLFIAANIYIKVYILIPAACVVGLAAGFLWTAHGAYLTNEAVVRAEITGKSVQSEMGKLTSVFFVVFLLSAVVGNLFSSFILEPEVASFSSSALMSDETTGEASEKSKITLFIVYSVICVLSNICFFFLPPSGKPSGAPKEDDDQEKPLIAKEETAEVKEGDEGFLRETFRMHLDPKFLLLIPVYFTAGISEGFVAGDYTNFFVRPSLGVDSIGYFMSLEGLAGSFASLLGGQLIGKLGLRFPFLTGGLSFVLGVGFWLFAQLNDGLWCGLLDSTSDNVYSTVTRVLVLGVFALLLGCGYGMYTSVFITSVTSTIFTEKSECAFAAMKMWQSVGTGLYLMFGMLPSLNFRLIFFFVCLLLSIVCTLVVDKFFFSLGNRENKPIVV